MEKKITKFSYSPMPNGRSYYLVECPFCQETNLVYAWRGRKKCNCGADISTHLGKVTKEE